MATDVYKLEWTRSRSTIQTGVSAIMAREAFMDTIVVCRDGAVTHNKLTLGLVFPELHKVAVFDLPIEHTLLVPDFTVFEVQALIGAIFPHSEEAAGDRSVGEGSEVELEPAHHFGHFLGSEAWESPPPHHGHTWTGSRRGRGRPPLSGARLPARFQCDYCNKGFYYRSMLTAHEKLHTGGKRETCEVCGAEYSTRQNLKNHMIKYHGADSFVPRKRGRPPVVREGGVGRGRGGSRPPSAPMVNHTPPVEVQMEEDEEEVQMVEEVQYKSISAPPVHHNQEVADENNGLSGGSDGEGEVEEVGAEEGKEVEELGGSSPPRHLAEEPGEYQIEEAEVEKLSILTKPELVAICLRNRINVTGEKRALAARILRKLGPVFQD